MSTILKQESSPDPLNPMTNEEKFRTPDERSNAHQKFCLSHNCSTCPANSSELLPCVLCWLALEAEKDEEEHGIIMSCEPESCDDIFSGKKQYEVRKIIPKNMPTNTKVYVYKSGSGTVVGEFMARFSLQFNVRNAEDDINSIILISTGLTRSQLLDYLGNAKRFYEIRIEDPILYETPIPLRNFGISRAPKSWCYIKNCDNTKEE